MRNSTHIDKDSLSAQRFSEGVGNRHVYFPADSYKACPIEIPDTEIERSSIDRRARFFLLCVQIGDPRIERNLGPLGSDYLETDPLGAGGQGTRGSVAVDSARKHPIPLSRDGKGLGSTEINVAQWAKVTR